MEICVENMKHEPPGNQNFYWFFMWMTLREGRMRVLSNFVLPRNLRKYSLEHPGEKWVYLALGMIVVLLAWLVWKLFS